MNETKAQGKRLGPLWADGVSQFRTPVTVLLLCENDNAGKPWMERKEEKERETYKCYCYKTVSIHLFSIYSLCSVAIMRDSRLAQPWKVSVYQRASPLTQIRFSSLSNLQELCFMFSHFEQTTCYFSFQNNSPYWILMCVMWMHRHCHLNILKCYSHV